MRPFKFAREEDFSLQQQPEQQPQPESTSEEPVTDQTPEVVEGDKASKFSNTIIISGFSGLGKSTYCREKEHNSLDLESSMYSRTQDGKRNEEFPGNYINMIKWHLVNMNWKYIFVAGHQVVRDALRADNIKFYCVYPSADRKEEIINLCRERGNHEEFITKLTECWDSWASSMAQEQDSFELTSGEFINDELFDTKLKFLKR